VSKDKKRITLGIILIAAGILGLIVSLSSSIAWSYPVWRGVMHPMMGGWRSSGELKEVEGIVEKIEWMGLELEVDGKEVEVHGPSWFWQQIKVKEGDEVTAKGVFTVIMEHGKGWHQELVPFELRVNGETYGDVKRGIPVWMQ